MPLGPFSVRTLEHPEYPAGLALRTVSAAATRKRQSKAGRPTPIKGNRQTREVVLWYGHCQQCRRVRVVLKVQILYGLPMNASPRRTRTEPAVDDVRAILDAIRHIVRVLRVSSRAAEKRVGLSAAQLFALHQLAEGRALSVNELAQRTFTHQSSVSVVAQRLVRRGLATRTASRLDGRRVELRLTPKGRMLLHRAPEPAQERLIAALQQLRGQERRQLARTLTRLVRALGVGEEVAGMFFEENTKPGRR